MPSTITRNRRNQNAPTAAPSGAEFVGEDLYKKLVVFLEDYVNTLRESCQHFRGIELLEHYNQVWNSYRFSSTAVNGIFSYLNRHWIKRELDEGKTGIYEVYNVRSFFYRVVLCNIALVSYTLLARKTLCSYCGRYNQCYFGFDPQ